MVQFGRDALAASRLDRYGIKRGGGISKQYRQRWLRIAAQVTRGNIKMFGTFWPTPKQQKTVIGEYRNQYDNKYRSIDLMYETMILILTAALFR